MKPLAVRRASPHDLLRLLRSGSSDTALQIGAKILDTLDEAMRLRDKVLLVLSEASIASEWVEDEVTKAFEEERQHGGVVLFPVRVDDAVFDTRKPGRPSCAPIATSATSAPGKITTPARKSSSGARRPQPETGGRPTTALGA